MSSIKGKNDGKIGLLGLSGIVFGAMIGGGIFNLPQNMAQEAGPQGAALAWLITAVGFGLLVLILRRLSVVRPDLKAGIYQYAGQTFGRYAGFNVAWGYWLCTAFGNVAYAVMLNDSLGAFFPSLLQHGWPTIALGTAMVWGMYFMVGRGIHTASAINVTVNVTKMGAIMVMIAALVMAFQVGRFDIAAIEGATTASLPGIWSQIENSMAITLWCFIGIEGAVTMASRARRRRDVGRAGIIGFLCAWILYFAVTMLSYGVAARADIAVLENPSTAYLLQQAIGPWAFWFVIVAVIVSLTGGWVSWTLVCSQVPYQAAEVGIMPKGLAQLNSKGMPMRGLLISSIAMEAFLLLVVTAENVYNAALVVTGMMILPAYLFSALYLLKISMRHGRNLWRWALVGFGGVVYCCFMIYSSRIELMAATSLLYLAALPFYINTVKNAHPRHRYFGKRDALVLLLLVVAAVVSLWMLTAGHLSL